MSKTTTIIVAVVVVVVILAAVGAFFLLKGNEKNDPNQVTFLIEDNNNNYYWIEGSGETGADAFLNAIEKYKVDAVHSNTGFGLYVEAIDGKYATETYTNYWALYVYDNAKGWTASGEGISSIVSSEHEFLAWFYVDANPETYESTPPSVIPSVNDVVLKNRSA